MISWHPSYGYATPKEIEELKALPIDVRKGSAHEKILRRISRRAAEQRRKEREKNGGPK